MIEIDGGEAEKIVAAESSNSRHLPRLSLFLGCGSKVKTQKRELSWVFKTLPGWTRLNTDSASKCNPAHAGAGRLVRDALHRFIMGSEAGVGYCNILKDESWETARSWTLGVLKCSCTHVPDHPGEYFLDPWEVFKGELRDGIHPKHQRMKDDRHNRLYMDEMVGGDPNINIVPLYATL
ncbi:hypothetical protein SADUNF_Sadunf05G0155000 [Salix dunnii]|uniref:Uncharacterized protein n=1 Tax=Salix dunnii TaxID=1413687 RepID=A0A835K4C7_9ROSI|nr:hypothetical protein SADUNF_Sadunf05G0155000 [Salix dunnii]